MSSARIAQELGSGEPERVLWGGSRPESVFEAFQRAVERYPDHPFLNILPETATAYGVEPGEITYVQAARAIAEIAESFHAAGYRRGERVGLLAENRPIYFFSWFALNSLGIPIVPINPDLRRAELEYLVAHSDLVAAVVLPSRRGDIEAAAAAMGRSVALIGPNEAPARRAGPSR